MAKKPPKRGNFEVDVATALQPYALELGSLLVDWNNLHSLLQMIFLTVMDNPELERQRDALVAIWNAVPNDRMQRNILRQATLARFKSFAEETEDDRNFNKRIASIVSSIKWLLDHADALGRQRDDAAHLPIGVSFNQKEGIQIIPMDGFGHPIAAQFQGKKLEEEFRLYRNRTAILNKYAGDLWRHLLGHVPLPDTPIWPTSPRPSEHKAGKAK